MSNKGSKSKRKYFIYLALYGFLATMFLYGSISKITTLNTKIKKKELKTVKGILKTDPEIYDKELGSKHIDFKLIKFPEFEFRIDFPAYQATRKSEFMREIHKNDSIEVDIERSEFEKKLLKSQDLSIFDNINYHFINIYGIRAENRTYLTLTDYNNEDNADSKYSWWIYLIVSIIFMIALYFEIKSFRKKYL